MGLRRQARELALQSLYLIDVCKLTEQKALTGITHGADLDSKSRKFLKQLISGTLANKDQLDGSIIKYSKNWELQRMAALDRNILRLGAYELIYELETPVSVIIDEAVEIAKTYSTDDSGKFVNGILDKIKDERNNTSGNLDGEKADVSNAD